MRRSALSATASPRSAPAATARWWRSGFRRSARLPNARKTSYLRCWIARVPTARSTRSGMCSRRFMGAIASRSSSRRERREGREGLNGNGVQPKTTSALPSPELLDRLTHVQPGEHRVVTCYLKLEPRDRSRGKYLIKVKNRVKSALQSLPRLGLHREISEEVARDLNRVQEFLRLPGNLPHSQGLAIFACEGLGLFEMVPLPVVHRSRLAVDTSPLVRELASVEDEFGRLITVVLDRSRARFFEVTAHHSREVSGLHSDTTRGKRFHSDNDGSSGWGEH